MSSEQFLDNSSNENSKDVALMYRECACIAAFSYLNAYQKREIDCDLNSHDNCMSAWQVADWKLTNSEETPMGPAHDRRWEGLLRQFRRKLAEA